MIRICLLLQDCKFHLELALYLMLMFEVMEMSERSDLCRHKRPGLAALVTDNFRILLLGDLVT